MEENKMKYDDKKSFVVESLELINERKTNSPVSVPPLQSIKMMKLSRNTWTTN
jgi:hypothetical protein